MSLVIGTASGATTLDGDQLVEGVGITHIARHGDSWWAVDDHGGVRRDGEIVASMPADATAHCVLATDQTVWVGADKARLYYVDDGSLSEDEFFAEAPGRDTWYTPWGAPADVRSMAVDADHTLYANVHVGGILRYDNTGVVPTIDIDADVHQVATHPLRKGAVFAACAFGLAASSNGHDFVIRSDGLHASYCRAVAVLDDQVMISASTGPGTERGRLYRGDLWEGRFEPLMRGLPEWFDGNLNTHCLLVSKGFVYAGHGETVWCSDDGGDTWEIARSGLDSINCLG